MRKKKKPDRFFLYIIISLIIHLVIFIYFPYGELSVMGSSDKGTRDFGFIQFVEYKPEIPNVKTDRKSEIKPRVNQKETKPEIKQEPEPKPEAEPKQKIDNKPKPEPDPKPPSKPDKTPSTENKSVTKPEPYVKDNEVISSENSDINIEVAEKKNSTQDKDDTTQKEAEKKVKPEPKPTPPPPPPSAGDLIVNAPVPNYPKDLVGEQHSGEVKLLVNIKSDGQINNVNIIESSGYEQMDRTAELTIKRGWKFSSYKKPYSIIIFVKYNIDDKGNSIVKVETGELTFK